MGCNSVGKALNIVETISFVSWDRDWKVFTKYVIKLGISKENFENASHILYQNYTITSYILHYYCFRMICIIFYVLEFRLI